ncbi:hypothetical protein A4R69_09350 [Corynebacterium pseudotuberculosis]|nr:hypothetical protein A4R69_09350 [Corynebacterium pseudotuberculosis]
MSIPFGRGSRGMTICYPAFNGHFTDFLEGRRPFLEFFWQNFMKNFYYIIKISQVATIGR